ncbi:MAG: glutathione S-transferase family protein [Microcoleus sp. PH2017_10_PVI_O_A]|uniref:glutathione S-transferase family protein n=1 Tax=unclassified Microcoleus TaxID=2642155 RepID=UPI001E171A34|nr:MULTISPECIES: glutathione S-transferase family protein [unclassified Microcoleus]TAE82029.1 MAG: glutathione S-transferase family protein [Oscillatoriales cyanobacterium]MCC3406705.1 glutathione S-transferase family protein [Microcoleus sp. PH2017_10_PVI_O_A]MCC3460701.1 glutathione S-transferase family protein [Microcoleus sp. PH2017_11_PCY_U_A]MCC3479264.1 glutathione S-transferase family protein [Microcoleus sp. PH2017_12_PCY_D_A]MCC3528203.1 glutathione S-transferase family protein [Mic
MLKLYYNPLSSNARRVWIALLEKEIEFELVALKLNGDQFQPNFLAISPFHHVPVLADGDFHVIESLAILDYLEAKYPAIALLPQNPRDLAIVRMVETVTVNELTPALSPFVRQTFGGAGDPEKLEKSGQQVAAVLSFFEELLGDRAFFGGSNTITLADVVAGVSVPWLPELGLSLENYPKLQAWCDRLNSRASWQQTQASPELVEAFKVQMKQLMKGQSNQSLNDEINQLRKEDKQLTVDG